MNHDYSAVRDALLHAIGLMDDARTVAGRMNLYPTLSPVDARRRIDELDSVLDDVRAEVDAARRAATEMARRGLSVASDASQTKG